MTDKKSSNSKKGFASNPQNINRNGRPKGSRNKSSLIKAQLNLDDLTVASAELLEALVHNDKEALGITDDVPLKLRFDAANKVLDKAIANEREKEKAQDSLDSKSTGSKSKEEVQPVLFSITAE